jgi:hypothetical protein
LTVEKEGTMEKGEIREISEIRMYNRKIHEHDSGY